jgi:hypothetical protein
MLGAIVGEADEAPEAHRQRDDIATLVGWTLTIVKTRRVLYDGKDLTAPRPK